MAETTVTTAVESAPTETETIVEPVAEKDEDYRWLTERLDGHTVKLTEVALECRKLTELNQQQMTANLEETRTLITSLTEMVKTQSESLTALAASVTLQLTQKNSETTSPVTAETVTEVVPENVVPEVTRENHAEGGRRRRERVHL